MKTVKTMQVGKQYPVPFMETGVPIMEETAGHTPRVTNDPFSTVWLGEVLVFCGTSFTWQNLTHGKI